MDSTIQALIQIDEQAAKIASSVSEEKLAMSAANEKKIAEFDANIQAETDASVAALKEKTEKKIMDEAKSLKEQTDADIEKLTQYYELHHDTMAGEIFEKVTGCKWEA